MNKFKSLAVAFVLSVFSGFSFAEVSVIGSPGLPVDVITKDQAENLFLGKAQNINGVSVSIFDLSGSEAARAEFLEKVMGKTESQLKAYWSRQVFTGKGQPPKQGSAGDAVEFVTSSNEGISYVDSGSVPDGVKVLGVF